MENILKKWNFAEHRYEDVENIWGIELIFEFGIKTICANCKKPLLSNNGYTSNQWHTEIGFGYSVCEECYETERELDKKYRA